METKQVLEIAEGIITNICNEEIINKYFRVKNKLFSSDLEGKLSEIQEENAFLKNKINEINLRKRLTSLDQYITQELLSLEFYLMPDSFLKPSSNTEDACENVLHIFNIRHDSSDQACKKLQQENYKLHERINGADEWFKNEIIALQQHHIEAHEAHEKYKEDCSNRLKEIDQEYKDIEMQIIATYDENKEIVKSITSKEGQISKIKLIYDSVINRYNEIDAKNNEIRKKIDLIQAQCDIKDKKINAMRENRNSNLKNASPRDLDKLRKLESEIAALMLENEKISLELKRTKITPSLESMDSTFVSFIDN